LIWALVALATLLGPEKAVSVSLAPFQEKVLPPVPVFFAFGFTDGEMSAFRWVLTRLGFPEPKYRILVIDGEDFFVQRSRANDINAFGLWTADDPGPSSGYHAIGEPGRMPFKSEVFHMVYWFRAGATDKLKAVRWLADVTHTLEHGGLFIFAPIFNPGWQELLKQAGWQRLPFAMSNLDMWRKPSRTKKGNGFFKRYYLTAA